MYVNLKISITFDCFLKHLPTGLKTIRLRDYRTTFRKLFLKIFKGTPHKILFLRIDRIGDAIVTLPFLRDLKLNYPDLEIHVIASKRNYSYFTDTGYIDKLFEYTEDIEFDYPASYKRFFFLKASSQ